MQWLENRANSRTGTLHLTKSHMLFIDTKTQSEEWILHSHIASIETPNQNSNTNTDVMSASQSSSASSAISNFSSNIFSSSKSKQSLKQVSGFSSSGYRVTLKLKIHRIFCIKLESSSEYNNLVVTLQNLSKPKKITDLYAFIYAGRGDKTRINSFLFDMKREYIRLGVGDCNENNSATSNNTSITSNSAPLFQICQMNKNYTLCSTYPKLLAFPSQALPNTIFGSAKFRSRNRLPSLTYYHKESRGSIHRCSQPLSGLQNNRSAEDEQLCEYICKSTNQQAYIFDTRPKLNAIANRAQGKGYEDERFYKHAKVQFLPIDNIHVVRKSLENFIDGVENSKSFGDFYGNIEKSGWVGHLSSILGSSITVADKVENGSPCILHCSDGWDRTSQVGSLAQILLDPFYRTIEGFLVLVNKDWLKFGHQMQHRLGHINPVQYTSSHGAQNLEQEQSPIFAQWLEIIHQLVRSFPSDFEFNSSLLINTFYHATSCQFGTFLTNNDQNRSQIIDGTYCFFEYVLANKMSMTSVVEFLPGDDFLKKVFLKNVEKSWSLWEFWSDMYCQRSLEGKDMVESFDGEVCFGGTPVGNKSVPEIKKSMNSLTENFKNESSDDVVEISPAKPHKSGKSNSSNSPNKLAEELGYCTVKDELVTVDGGKSNNFDPLGVL